MTSAKRTIVEINALKYDFYFYYCVLKSLAKRGSHPPPPSPGPIGGCVYPNAVHESNTGPALHFFKDSLDCESLSTPTSVKLLLGRIAFFMLSLGGGLAEWSRYECLKVVRVHWSPYLKTPNSQEDGVSVESCRANGDAVNRPGQTQEEMGWRAKRRRASIVNLRVFDV
jgi:hypothetical protein